MRTSKGAQRRAARQAAFDIWKAANPIVFAIFPLQPNQTTMNDFIKSLNGMLQYQRTDYTTFRQPALQLRKNKRELYAYST